MDPKAALLELQKRIERRFDPAQARDNDGKWTDGPVGAAATYTLDAFRKLYGDEVDDRYAGDFSVSIHDRGDFVLSFVHENGEREVLLDGLDSDRANAIADGLDWAATAHLHEDDENDPDTGLVDFTEVDDGIVVGYDKAGDVSLRLPKHDDALPGQPGDYEVLDIDASDATDLERALRDMADAYDEFGDEEDGGDGMSEEPQSTRARVLALADEIKRKYNPGQLRDPGGEDGGQWVKSPAAAAQAAGKDLLELAGRIDLDPRETLVSSGRIKDDQGDLDLNFAVVHSPAGNEVRLGAIPSEDSGKWRAGDFGGTAILDTEQLGKLRTDLTDAAERAKKAAKQADANPDSRDPILMGHAPVAEGVVPTDWEDVTWNIYLNDSDPIGYDTVIKTGDPDLTDGVRFEPKRLAALLKQLGAIDADLADSDTTRSQLSRMYAADGGGTRTGKEPATNTGPKGGQFAPGGGRVGGKGKPPPKKRPAKQAPAKPAGPLGFDAKTGRGAGYGVKGGDPNVRTLQSVANRFGLTDMHGEELALDGKFGPRTTSVVKKLQKAMGLEPTGKVTLDFIKQISNAKSLEDLRPPKSAPKPRKRVRRSAEHLHELDNGICRTCTPTPEHVLVNGVCVSCGDAGPKAEASRGAQQHVLTNGVCVTCQDSGEVVRALIEAFDEIFRTRYVRTPAGSKRYGLPIGAPIGGGGAHLPAAVKPAKTGRTTLKDRIVSAIEQHLDGKGDGKPLAGFTREQLRQVAKARGIPLERGERRESIERKLLDHVAPPKPETPRAKALTGAAALKAAPIEMGEGERLVRGTKLARKKHVDALALYAGDGYYHINDDLREGKTIGSAYAGSIRSIDEVMEKSRLTDDITVHRGVKSLAMFGAANRKRTDLTGLEFKELAYSSTTADPNVADEFYGEDVKGEGAILHIRVPAGTGAVQLSRLGPKPPPDGYRPYEEEAEMLLDRGLTYRIVDDRIVDGRRQLDAEVVV